ncbi:hypothetical protein SNEBB_011058 [Seison nebaliae]|nr:hypothetical protein SNEBB_011058 [Seison nebaliae]
MTYSKRDITEKYKFLRLDKTQCIPLTVFKNIDFVIDVVQLGKILALQFCRSGLEKQLNFCIKKAYSLAMGGTGSTTVESEKKKQSRFKNNYSKPN